jgi:glutamate synthase (NADPH/NADH) small chain
MTNKKQIASWERDIDRRASLRIKAMRLEYRPVEERIQDFDEACLGFTPETARVEASRCIQCPSLEACILACPLNNDIPSAMWEISQGNFIEAANIYRQTSNFPELCGRLCPDEVLCAGSCGVGMRYPMIRLGRLEAFVADLQREADGIQIPSVISTNGKQVAVVGSGPASLTVAEELVRLGHKVTIFESQRRTGGTLIYTIPRFRLPVEIVEAKVVQLEHLGVNFVLGIKIGQDVTLDGLCKQGFQAVFLGTGAGSEFISDLPGTDLKSVYLATDYLMRTNLNQTHPPLDHQSPLTKGKRVTIFGNGHAAVDCARTAVRMGAQEVSCFHSGSETDMECRLEDAMAAQEEGVDFVPLARLIELIGDPTGHVAKVVCQRMRTGGREHRSQPTPIEGSKFTVDTDLVVLAPSLAPDPMIQSALELEVDSEGWLIADRETGQTDREGIFAAGDNTGRQHLAVMAIAEGRKVAASIHNFLSDLG